MLLSGCDSLSTLAGGKPNAEQTCSSQTTYDALTEILASQAKSATSVLGVGAGVAAAASPAAFKNVIAYSAPTVEDVNKTTGKVTCKALLRINAPTALLTGGRELQPNDFGPDHVTYAIGYSVQTTADRGQPLTTLENASALSTVAFEASLAALKRSQDAAAAATPPEPEDDRAAEESEPSADEAQAALERANRMDEFLRDPPADTAAPTDEEGTSENQH